MPRFRLGSASVARSTGATAIRLRFAPMVTTAIILTLARRMGTTARRGLAAVSSSAPVPGTAVTATAIAADMVMATVAGTATATGAVMVMAPDTVEDTAAD